MKECSNCNVEKPYQHFSKHRLVNDGYNVWCKECCSRSSREWRRRAHNKKYIVYYLPEEHYVGCTNSFNKRMSQHRTKGKSTDNCEILLQTNCKSEASKLESSMHRIGYFGAHPSGSSFDKMTIV